MMSTLNRKRVLAAVLAAVMPFTSAHAANVSPVTVKFDVTMSVVPDCTVTAAPIDFGLGYALPGRAREWPLPPDVVAGMPAPLAMQAMVNTRPQSASAAVAPD